MGEDISSYRCLYETAALLFAHRLHQPVRSADAVGTAAKAALAQAKTPKGDAAPSGTKVACRRGKASRHASAESENQL
jgi:hypothetical protein